MLNNGTNSYHIQFCFYFYVGGKIMNIEKMKIKSPFKDKIGIFCGGSKGMGKETAKLFVELGGSVFLMARNEGTLKNAVEECRSLKQNDSQFCEYQICDTSDFELTEKVLSNFVIKYGVPDYLFNTVGYAYPNYFEKYSIDDFRKNMEVNYFGVLNPIYVLVPHFIKARKGYIANTSSVAGFLGLFGYATYSPTKFAIVGLTEVLRNELKPYNIHCSILFPSDTRTDGYETENLTKPPECQAVSSTGKIMEPEQVAEAFIRGILKKKFNITPGGAKFVWNVKRFIPKITYAFIDNDVRNAQKAMRKTKNKQ